MDTATVERLSGVLRSGAGVSETTRPVIERWLSDPNYEVFGPEIAALIESKQWGELEDAFYTQLTVGTGGIRGRVGPGTNRINLRTIGEAAQALSRFIAEYGDEYKRMGVVVGHEARRLSKEFATLCCEIFAANGIQAYLLDGLRATPEISFAVRHLKTAAGVQITASHNPRTDNGFKFYWSDGGQVVPPHDARFMQMVKEVGEIQRMPFDKALAAGLVTIVGADVDREYLTAVRTLSVDKARSARIVFSPIHGAGSTNVLPVLQAEGFDVTVVPEQAEPNAEFPTAVGDLINPEFREVMELPIKLAEQVGADLAICSDPDADRIGVAARKRLDGNEVEFLTGNQVGIALTQYILERRQARGALAPNHLVIETCVTSTLIADVAESFGLKPLTDLFVGYKFIAQEIAKLQDPTDFVFSAEESLGYLAGTFVRDKDAAIAALFVAELASAQRPGHDGAAIPGQHLPAAWVLQEPPVSRRAARSERPGHHGAGDAAPAREEAGGAGRTACRRRERLARSGRQRAGDVQDGRLGRYASVRPLRRRQGPNHGPSVRHRAEAEVLHPAPRRR